MLNNKLQNYWNASTTKIPLDKDPSIHTIDTEKLFFRNSNVCDLGGGTGVSAFYFLAHGHSVTLVDISDYALEIAKQKAAEKGFENKLKTIQKDFSEGNIPLEDNIFDIVYSRLSLHYFLPERLKELFSEVVRILKPQGKAFITVKSPGDIEETKFLKETAKEIEDGVFDDNGQIKTRFSKKRLGEILKEAGVNSFEISDYIEDNQGKRDVVKSGKNKLLLLEIVINKNCWG